MNIYNYLAKRVERAGFEIQWYGPVSREQVCRLEELLAINLPNSFKDFLQSHGGGGVVSADVSGIEDNDAEIDFGGTVLGDTMRCRKEYELPQYLAVVYFHDDEVCWCLDTSQSKNGECPVVSYDVFRERVDRVIATDFFSFFKHHLELYGVPS
ncbi:SMI1/KNR4 family protein [Bordetella sp. LUAb4]|uniref:SMI1/KNR4 family protein n=1 Tax=Bordetella sp. LUAb4 TaxID=2843195 RepID=UPI001E2F9594|nr:SMI1/KNR4 family protein [Bordetella sp. LUAb4]